MRVRCSKNGCPFDVPDDMVGARIRCPHCGHLMFVEPETSEQVQPGVPPAAKPKDAVKLENQLYDGLPPLSVMMALRRQQANLPEAPASLEMTEDDWKALSAYEQVLHAEQSLWSSLLYGLAALGFNLIAAWWVLANRASQSRGEAVAGLTLGVPVFIMLIPGLIHAWSARQQLGRLRVDLLVTSLPFTLFCTTFVYGGYVAAYGFMMFQRQADDLSLFAGLWILINLIAGLDTGKAWLQLVRGLRQVEPSEILHRLTEALKYLPRAD